MDDAIFIKENIKYFPGSVQQQVREGYQYCVTLYITEEICDQFFRCSITEDLNSFKTVTFVNIDMSSSL